MTNNTNRLRCTDCNILLSVRNKGNEDLCSQCYDLAALENNHQDGYHDNDADGPHEDCLMCNPDARKPRDRKSNVVAAHTKRSHNVCYAAGTHEATPAGRAACRATGGPAERL